MEQLDILAYWLGWAVMVLAAVLVFCAGLPTRIGAAPRGMVRLLFYGVGIVYCRWDLQPRLCERLVEMGYRFYGSGRGRLAVALPGRIRRTPHGARPGRAAAAPQKNAWEQG